MLGSTTKPHPWGRPPSVARGHGGAVSDWDDRRFREEGHRCEDERLTGTETTRSVKSQGMAKSQTQALPFLDTSVVRSLLMGSQPYREFLQGVLGERLYVSRFVDMEFKRGVLLTLIDFLNTLAMPHLRTIEDAERTWSNRFQGRQVKLVLALSASIFDGYRLDRTSPRDKERGITRLAVVIKSLDRAMRYRFKRVSSDRTHCPRGEQPIRTSVAPDRAKQELNVYADNFQDTTANRQKCRMDKFLEHFERDLMACTRHIETLPDLEQHERLKKMATNAEKVQKDPSLCSCHTCEKLGDAVIALGAPRDLQLETTDESFQHWCGPIKQPHRLHRSELDYLNSLGESKATT